MTKKHKIFSTVLIVAITMITIVATPAMTLEAHDMQQSTSAIETIVEIDSYINPIERIAEVAIEQSTASIEEIVQVEENQQVETQAVKETKVTESTYTKKELELLSKIIYAEAGCTWLSDLHQQMVGNVVLNRVSSDLFPDTIEEVIFQKGQYSPTFNRSKWNNVVPDERTIANAKLLLEGFRVCPENVVFQAEFKQGKGVFMSISDKHLGTTYFCYY